MHLLISSHAFHPSIGGLERTSELLAEEFCRAGHQVELVTATPNRDMAWDVRQPFRIWRQPSLWKRLRLLVRADRVLTNGASLSMALPAVLLRKPLVIIHTGYHLVSVDGLGWGSEGPTPLHHVASLTLYRSRMTPQAWVRQLLLLRLRIWVAHRAAANVAITHWVANRQPLPRQKVIPNPVALPPAEPGAKSITWQERPVELLFLGRLVQEKGLGVVLDALAELRLNYGLRPKLSVVGEGPMHQTWLEHSEQLGLTGQVQFLGSQRGSALRECLGQARIGVVPSLCEEPMGIVAIEMLAAGLVTVVSTRGGLAEVVGLAGVCVPNGDVQAWAACLQKLLHNPAICLRHLEHASSTVQAFKPNVIAERYLRVLACAPHNAND